jgi:hypothetical protein
MRSFKVTVRTATKIVRYWTIGTTAAAVHEHATDAMGDTVCGITVIPS